MIENSWSYQCLQYYYFGPIDYTIFWVMLVFAAGVGIYLSYRSKDKSVDDYMLGGRKMHAFPTSLSMMSTSLSAITVLGTPAEFYSQGLVLSIIYHVYEIFSIMYIWMCLSNAVGLFVSAEVFTPIFYKLQVQTTYEYLELRFDQRVRQAVTLLFVMLALVFTGLAIYAPSTALAAVTGTFDL